MDSRSTSPQKESHLSDSKPERLVQIGDDVIDVFDAHAEADAAGGDTGRLLLRQCHLSMRRRCRMAGERFRIAEVHQTLEQLELIVEAHSRLGTAKDLECHQRASPA